MTGEPQIGSILGGRYRLVARLGAGGMGIVYKAVHEVTRREVAVKILPPEHATDAERVALFRKEAMAAAALDGLHIVQVLDAGVDAGTAFVVLELLRGRDLEQEIRASGAFSLSRAVRVVSQLLRALAVAHRAGIVHRDVKPANVFLVESAELGPDFVKILDFGIAKIVEGSALTALAGPKTATGAAVGTLAYMSPEQLFGRHVDARTDLYAAGLVLSECLTGRRAIDAGSIGELVEQVTSRPLPRVAAERSGLPPAIDAFLARACAKEPGDRFSDAATMEAALARVPIDPLAATGLVTASPSLPAPGAPRRSSRSAWVAAGVLLVGATAVLSVGWPRASCGASAVRPPEPLGSPAVVAVSPSAPDAPHDAATLAVTTAVPSDPDGGHEARPEHAVGAAGSRGARPREAPSCPPGELASRGHCCPIGEVWLGSRCGRPLASP